MPQRSRNTVQTHTASSEAPGRMRIRISSSEAAAVVVRLAKRRPDVVLTAARPRPGAPAGEEFELGLLGSFSADARALEVRSLVRTWAAQLRHAVPDAAVEVVP